MQQPRAILITGASSGIGRALALAYAAPGLHLTLLGRNEQRLADVAAAAEANGATVTAIPVDVRDREAMHGAVLRMGYRPTVRVAKTRRVATLEHCSVCVDDVDGVGVFLELQRMVPDETAAASMQAELAALKEQMQAHSETASSATKELESLQREREAVRQRVEAMLAQMDELL